MALWGSWLPMGSPTMRIATAMNILRSRMVCAPQRRLAQTNDHWLLWWGSDLRNLQRLAAQALEKSQSLGALGKQLPVAQPEARRAEGRGESRGSLQDAQDAPVAMEQVEQVEQVEAEQGMGA